MAPILIFREPKFLATLVALVLSCAFHATVGAWVVHGLVISLMLAKLVNHYFGSGPLADEPQRVRDFFMPKTPKPQAPRVFLCIGTILNNANAHYQKFLIKEVTDVAEFVDTYRNLKISFSLIYCIEVSIVGSLAIQVKNHLHNRHSSVSSGCYLASTNEIENCLVESGCKRLENSAWECKNVKTLISQLPKLKDEEENEDASEIFTQKR
jgi:hypothetical protein